MAQLILLPAQKILMIQVRKEDEADFSDALLAKIFLPTLQRDDG